MRATALLLALLTLEAAPAAAAPRRRAHAAAIVTGAIAATAVEAAIPALEPAACRWCARNRIDEAARRALRWDDPAAADLGSDLASHYLAPGLAVGALLLAAGRHRTWPRAFDDLAPVAQAYLATNLLTQAIKLGAGRERPFARDSDGAAPPANDQHLSFVSGHTSSAFALATAAGMVAQRRGSPLAPWIWTIGLANAAAAGVLRIGADAHYLTDVLAGAALGAAVGVAVPLLHDLDAPLTVAATPTAAGPALVASGTW